MNQPQIFDIIIIGAGIAGLGTYEYLLNNLRTPLTMKILESRDRVGGRIYTASINNKDLQR